MGAATLSARIILTMPLSFLSVVAVIGETRDDNPSQHFYLAAAVIP
jgi:hypothetical protein